MQFGLYLESGPRHRKTMVHVFDLLGLNFTGPSTVQAIEDAPAAIRRFLRYLAGHGETVDPDEPFDLEVRAHVTDGSWLANGDPEGGFAPDFEPLSQDAIARHLRVYRWMYDDIMIVARETPVADLDRSPPGSTWSYRRLFEHVAEAEYEYIRCSLGHIEGLRPAYREMLRAGDPIAALEHAHAAILDRLASLSGDDLSRRTQRGAKTWTVARTFRRVLEHRWEHLQQIAAGSRLEVA
jgi:hypothetical protein